MKHDFWTLTVPVISTAHMPSHDALAQLATTTTVAPTETGAWVRALPLGAGILNEDMQWFLPITQWAWHHGFTWLRFDADGDFIADLATYEWDGR